MSRLTKEKLFAWRPTSPTNHITVVQANFQRMFQCHHAPSKSRIFVLVQKVWNCAKLHLTKCTAWVAISKNGIIDPYWFEDGNKKSQTANMECYVTILRKFWASLSWRRGINWDEQWFQQDSATSHTSTSLS